MEKTELINFILSNLPVPKQVLIEIATHFEERIILKNDFFVNEGKISNDYLFLENGFI